ncbi:MAG: 2'-5' RNA ligase family protein, partial [Hyphomicrobium sp.]
KVLWAGLAPCEALETLARAHARAARAAGLPPERRPFKAHITLARLKFPHIETLTHILAQKARIKFRAFVVDSFVLFSSKPLVGGGPYVEEEVFPLRGGRPYSFQTFPNS